MFNRNLNYKRTLIGSYLSCLLILILGYVTETLWVASLYWIMFVSETIGFIVGAEPDENVILKISIPIALIYSFVVFPFFLKKILASYRSNVIIVPVVMFLYIILLASFVIFGTPFAMDHFPNK